MVKRYDLEQFSGWEPNCEIEVKNEGDYVTYKDYADLLDVAREMAEDIKELHGFVRKVRDDSPGKWCKSICPKLICTTSLSLAKFKEFDNE